MKGKLNFVISTMAVLALASCGGGNKPAESSAQPSSSTPPSSSSIPTSTSSDVPASSSTEEKESSSTESSVVSSVESSEVSSEVSSLESSSAPSKKHWNEDGVLKILEIGNSYGEDTFQYGPDVLKALGVENFVLGKMYIGGSNIHDHNYFAGLDTKTKGSYDYRKITNETVPNWSLTEKTSVLFAINDEEWDFVCFQQQSMRATEVEAYEEFDPFLTFVDTNNKYRDSEYVFNMTWAYPEDNKDEKYTGTYHCDTTAMYADIVSTTQTVMGQESRIVKTLVPGTAVENARTSFLKKKLFRDDLHLTYDKGRYIAGMTYFSGLTDIELKEDFSFAPKSLNEAEKVACIESARNALAHNYEITSSSYPTDPTIVYNGIDHTVRLEAEDGILDGKNAKKVGCEFASGGYIAADINDCGQGLEWVHYAPVAGEHEIEIAYWTAFAGSKNAIFVNDVKVGEVVYEEGTSWANGFNDPSKVKTKLTLNQGYNTISLVKHGFGSDSPAYGGWVQIDYLDVIGTDASYDASSLKFDVTPFTLQAELGYFHTGGLPFYCDAMGGLYAVGEINEAGHGVGISFKAPVAGKYGLKITYSQGGTGNSATVEFNDAVVSYDFPGYANQAYNKANMTDIVLEAECSSEDLNYVSITRGSKSNWFIIDSITLVAIA